MRERPKLELIKGSDVWGEVDTSAICLDGRCRPVSIFMGADEDGFPEIEMNITVEDARRLLHFLSNTVFYFEGATPITLAPQ